MTDINGLSYIPLKFFEVTLQDAFILTGCNPNMRNVKSRKEVESIVDKVHKHLCGHSIFSDIQLLYERQGIWNNSVAKHVGDIMSNRNSCKATAPPQPMRKVSISYLPKNFF